MTIEKQLTTITNGNVELGSNYLKINQPLDDRQLADTFGALRQFNGSTLFWIGDYLVSTEDSRSKAYADALVATDYAKGTLMNAKRLCRKIPRELRVNLSYKHHEKALGYANNNVEVAVHFLREAEKSKPSVKEMGQQIVLSLGAPEKQVKATLNEVIDYETLNIQDAFYTIRRFLENTNSTTFHLKKEFVRAELETLTEWAQAVCT